MSYPNHVYQSGQAAGRKWDEILSRTLADATDAFFRKFQFETGMIGLVLPCGTGDTTLKLQSLVGGEGIVTGLDSNPAKVNIAKERASLDNQSNVQFFHKYINSWEEREAYDFVYSRLLFSQWNRPEYLMQQLFHGLKKGGWIMIEDMDLTNFYCYPACYAFDRYLELVIDLKKQQGANPTIVTQLPELLQKAGFVHSQVQAVQPTFLNPDSKNIHSLSLESLSDSLLSEGLTTASELHALLFELKAFENRHDTMISLPCIYQAWGFIELL